MKVLKMGAGGRETEIKWAKSRIRGIKRYSKTQDRREKKKNPVGRFLKSKGRKKKIQ